MVEHFCLEIESPDIIIVCIDQPNDSSFLGIIRNSFCPTAINLVNEVRSTCTVTRFRSKVHASPKRHALSRKYTRNSNVSTAIGLQPLLPGACNLRPKYGTLDLHPLLIERAHGCLDIALVHLVHELAHRFLGLRGRRVCGDGA